MAPVRSDGAGAGPVPDGAVPLAPVDYLSDDWLAAADAAVRSAPQPAPAELTIDQVVEGGPDWRIVIGPEPTITARNGAVGTADVTFHQTLETATAIAKGETDAHQAFLLGRIRFEGEIDRLIEGRDALAWLAEALMPVMADTNFSA